MLWKVEGLKALEMLEDWGEGVTVEKVSSFRRIFRVLEMRLENSDGKVWKRFRSSEIEIKS